MKFATVNLDFLESFFDATLLAMNLYLISLSELWHCVCRNHFLCEYIGNHHIEILTCTISRNTDRSTLEPCMILLCGSLLQDRLYLCSYFKYISLSDELTLRPV